jgi:hypothetical protein
MIAFLNSSKEKRDQFTAATLGGRGTGGVWRCARAPVALGPCGGAARAHLPPDKHTTARQYGYEEANRQLYAAVFTATNAISFVLLWLLIARFEKAVGDGADDYSEGALLDDSA